MVTQRKKAPARKAAAKRKTTRKKAADPNVVVEVDFGDVEFLRVFTPQEQTLIRDHWNDGKLGAGKTPAKSLNDTEFARGIFEAQRVGLEPLLDQIFPVKYWSSANSAFSPANWLTTIEVYRLIADRTDTYRPGSTRTVYEYEDSTNPDSMIKGQSDPATGLYAATVYVQKFVAGSWVEYGETAHWGEYADTWDNGKGKNLWGSKQRTMLAKCAEAKTLRRGFPRELGKIYVREEMDLAERDFAQDDVDIPAPSPPDLGEAKTGAAAEGALSGTKDSAAAPQADAASSEPVAGGSEGAQEEPPPPSDDDAPGAGPTETPKENAGEEAGESSVATEEELAKIREKVEKYRVIESGEKTEAHLRFLLGARCLLMGDGDTARAEEILFRVSEHEGTGFRSAKGIRGKTLRIVYGKTKKAYEDWESDGVAPDAQTGLPVDEPKKEKKSKKSKKKKAAPATSDVVSEAEETVREKSAEANIPVEALQAAAISIAKADSWAPALWATIAENWDAHFIDALNRYPNDRNRKAGDKSTTQAAMVEYLAAWKDAGGPDDSATALGVLSRYCGLAMNDLTAAHYMLGIEKAGLDIFGLVATWKEEGKE